GCAVATRLVRAAGHGRMPGERVDVARRFGPVVAEGRAGVVGSHQPAELDAHQHDVGVVRARGDPADVRGPGARREAPRWLRRNLLEGDEFLPRVAPLVT